MDSARRALVVGVNAYQDQAIPSLSGAVNDAKELRQRLVEFGDFQIPNEHFLLDEMATADNVRQALSDLLWRAEEADVVLIYFSGHGLTDKYDNAFIAPHDVRRASPLVRGIRMRDIRELMLAAKNKQSILLLLDCCYSGVAAEGERAVGGESPFSVVADALQIDAGSDVSAGKIVFASSGEDQLSREISETTHRLGNIPPHYHGAFTFEVLEGLDGGAAKDASGVSIDSLISYVNNQFTAKNAVHRPQMFGSGVTGDVWLARTTMESGLAVHIQRVRENLRDPDDYRSFVRAAQIIGQIQKDSPKFGDIRKLRSDVDKRFKLLERRARTYLVMNQLTLSEGCSKEYDRLDDLLSGVNCERVALEDSGLCGVLATLFDAAQSGGEIVKVQRGLIALGDSQPSVKIDQKPAANK
jgi:hypothetical protein